MSVYFESAAVQVTEGHSTVLCVVLEGVPGRGMTQDLSVYTQLATDTAGTHTHTHTTHQKILHSPTLRHIMYTTNECCNLLSHTELGTDFTLEDISGPSTNSANLVFQRGSGVDRR